MFCVLRPCAPISRCRELLCRNSRLSFSLSLVALSLALLMPELALADPVPDAPAFDVVAGTPSGDFGWDVFDTDDYNGLHMPDLFSTGAGSASISIDPSTSTGPPFSVSSGNLYAFSSIPVWDVNLTALPTAGAFTSIAVQFATTESASGNLSESSFLLGGAAPDDFVDLGIRGSIAGQGGAPGTPVYLYWAAWNGLSSTDNCTVAITAAGEHQSLVAARATYFNNSDAGFTIEHSAPSAVPEPSSAMALASILTLSLLRRRNR